MRDSGRLRITAICYREDLEERLGEALSRSLHIPAEHICVSGGTASMVYRIIFAFRPRRALVVVPTWTLYEKALKQYGCEVTEYVLSESGGFQPDDSLRSMIWEHSYDHDFSGQSVGSDRDFD